MKKFGVSTQTRNNWWVDAGLFISALIAAISGVYFLYLPKGGYEGGRNPMYGIVLLFERHTWEDLHTWAGIGMILVAIIHLVRHWSWVVNMARKMVKELTGRCGCMNARGRWNLVLNAVVALSFLLTAVSGIYFFIFPGGRGVESPTIILSSFTWDMIHTWAGIVLIATAVLHFAIHWKWVTKVTTKMVSFRIPFPTANETDNQPA